MRFPPLSIPQVFQSLKPEQMESVNRVDFKIRDLDTCSVTLFPTRAQISRNLKDVGLKLGTNEITIIGLSPTVDQDSINVQGSGSSAIITNITVEPLPNHDIFEDVYPDCGCDESDGEYEIKEKEPKKHGSALYYAKDRLRSLKDSLEQADETVASATHRLKILDSYAAALHDPTRACVDIEEGLAKYKRARAKTFVDRTEGCKCQRDLRQGIDDLKRQIRNIERREWKESAKETEAGEMVQNIKEENKKEKVRLRQERLNFWPRYCFSVCITIECYANTPLSSRRASVASEADFPTASPPKAVDPETVDKSPRCDLVLSYVTSAAGWSPSYDLQLSTTSATAALCFNAQLRNNTSETWSSCKVSVSTSPATFAGLEDATPALIPWKIKLAAWQSGVLESDILRSQEERNHVNACQIAQKGSPAQKLRHEMFEAAYRASRANQNYKLQLLLLEQQNKTRVREWKEQNPPIQQTETQEVPIQHSLLETNNAFIASNPAFAPHQRPPPAQGAGMFGSSAPSGGFGSAAATVSAPDASGVVQDGIGADEVVLVPFNSFEQNLDFEESLIEETDFAITHDLPGLKTLAPTSTSSKHHVARLKFANVFYSHTVVAKYKHVANLNAKLRNSSNLTLLRGQAGLTLDGTFMGRTTLPPCSAGGYFSLGLGVDPAIKVIYLKPDVRRAATILAAAIFSNENSSVYVRTVTLQNTRASADKPVSILVQDQIPVSEDGTLRVELLNPRGVSIEGPGVAAGDPGRDTGQDTDWGKATATLKKGGEVSWQVSLNAGKAVRLVLEYAVGLPAGEAAVQCW
ncbi:Protein F37C4.5 [Tolypocladium ophioglossoides CBS 100239]|uniref:Protein F37C4.5 n=1 Tax=Tolypocladium ophioglossoides (strain CBS 100239) TaxID=1163406 RepID=A0A0L0NE18_TOLOC|nr:Protein F37C4.5 [Tolypocladium ophioglossoides CBS 100239]